MVRRRACLWSLGLLAVASACQSNANSDGGSGGAAGHAFGGDGGAGSLPTGGAQSGASFAGATTNGGASEAGNAGTGGSAEAGSENVGSAGEGSFAGSGEAGTGGAGETGTAGSGEAGSGNAGAAGVTSTGSAREIAYVGAFLGGIFAFSVDSLSGVPTPLPGSPVDVRAHIGAIAVDPSQRFLYVADQRGTLDQLTLAGDGSLPQAPSFSTPIAGAPATLALAPSRRFAYVGSQSQTEPSIVVLALDADTGKATLTGSSVVLDAPPAYIALSPDGQFAYSTSATKVGLWAYRIDAATGALDLIDGSPFGGDAVFAGALAFTPNGHFLYSSGNGLNGFSLAANGVPSRIGTEPFSKDEFSDPSATNLALDAKGEFLYVTEFLGNERVLGFAIDAANGALTPTATPEVSLVDPYACAIDPSGRFLYVGQDVGTVAVYERDAANGGLRALDGSPFSPSAPQPALAFATRAR